ncbi:MAG: hypothetical protein Q9163_006015 [Psora crenata]
MSTRAEPSSARRTTRSSSRALSEDAASVGGESIATTRRGRTRRGGTPAKENAIKVPKVTNKPSKAYGAEGKTAYAQQMSATQVLDEAVDPIASAVHGAEEPALSTDTGAGRLPILSEEGEENLHGPGPRDPPRPPVEDASIIEPTSRFASLGSFFEGVTLWAPRVFRFGRQDPEVHIDVDAADFWEQWAVEENRRREEAEARAKTVRVILDTIKYLVFLLLLLTAVDLYIGPLLGPKYDFLRSRPQPSPGHAAVSQGTNVNRRLEKVEKLVQSLVSPSYFPKAATKHQINWFAAGNGAIVDPYLSSPVDYHCKSIKEHTWYSSLFSITGKCEDVSYPQGQALRPWTEPDERWCAPPSRGKLQLTVQIARPVAPTALIIEHMPKDASIHIGDAPKEIELWVDVPDEEVHSAVSAAIGRENPDLFAESSPQQERELDQQQALPFTFLPVGRWMYNIYEQEHVQTFQIPFPLQGLSVHATRFAVRVNSNWGDYGPTCIYRIRLHGHDQSGLAEEIDRDPRMA